MTIYTRETEEFKNKTWILMTFENEYLAYFENNFDFTFQFQMP